MAVFFLIIPIISFGIYLSVKNGSKTASASSVGKEQIKDVLLKVTQILGLLSGFGVLGGFLDDVLVYVGYINANFDQSYAYVIGLVDILVGFIALFKTTKTAAIVRLGFSDDAKAQSIGGAAL